MPETKRAQPGAYLIFHYDIDHQDYIEAYPTKGQDQDELLRCLLPVPDSSWPVVVDKKVLHVGFVKTESREEARRIGYREWINSTGDGFKELPYRRTKCQVTSR